MSVRENFTVQLQLPDRIECPQDIEDIYGAFEREANAYVRRRVSFGREWSDRDARSFVNYWWRGSLASARERLAELFRPLRDGESVDDYMSEIVDSLESVRKTYQKLREALGVRGRDEPAYWQNEDFVDAVWETVRRSTELGELDAVSLRV